MSIEQWASALIAGAAIAPIPQASTNPWDGLQGCYEMIEYNYIGLEKPLGGSRITDTDSSKTRIYRRSSVTAIPQSERANQISVVTPTGSLGYEAFVHVGDYRADSFNKDVIHYVYQGYIHSNARRVYLDQHFAVRRTGGNLQILAYVNLEGYVTSQEAFVLRPITCTEN